jgi:Fe-S-cluster containining protein
MPRKGAFLLMSMNLEVFKQQAESRKKANRAFYTKLKSKRVKNLDALFEDQHTQAFESIDCLNCANCCKTTSPIFYQRDIEQAAAALGLKPGAFIQTYLYMDEEGDFVLHQAPCPFLAADNRCTIYESRPTACREYPHTNRKKMQQILDLTFRNTLVCPAVLKITEGLKAALNSK